MRGWKTVTAAGALAALALLGCDQRRPSPRVGENVPPATKDQASDRTASGARAVGEEVGAGARKVGDVVNDAVEGFKEGVRGDEPKR